MAYRVERLLVEEAKKLVALTSDPEVLRQVLRLVLEVLDEVLSTVDQLANPEDYG